MAIENFPYMQVLRRSLSSYERSIASESSPQRSHYGPQDDVTAKVSAPIVQQRIWPAPDVCRFRTIPDNRNSGGSPNYSLVEGTNDNPLFLPDDLVEVRLWTKGLDHSEGYTIIFEGIVGGLTRVIQRKNAEEFLDCQDVECREVGWRFARDFTMMIYGQYHADRRQSSYDPTNSAHQILIHGAGPPDFGRCVFNPRGRPNRSSGTYKATNAYGDHWLFAQPGADDSEWWTYADILAYLMARYNADQTWVLNFSAASLAALEDYGALSDVARSDLVIEGMSFWEAFTTVCEAAGMRADVLVGGSETPVHLLNVFPATTGNAGDGKHLSLQSLGSDSLIVLRGSDNETEIGSNITSIVESRDIDVAQTRLVGLGAIEKHVCTLTLYPKWDHASNPPQANVDDGTTYMLNRYSRSGSLFGVDDNRFVFRRWSANFDGELYGLNADHKDGLNVTAPTVGRDLSSIFGYANVARERPFLNLPVKSDETYNATVDQRPIVEWRASAAGEWVPLLGSIEVSAERGELWIGADRLDAIVHTSDRKTFLTACTDALYSGGTVSVRVTCAIPGDRSVIAETNTSLQSETSFINGDVVDAGDAYRLVTDSGTSEQEPTILTLDDSAPLGSFLADIRDENHAGTGSGQVVLLTCDTYYKNGDRILGIQGGRPISFMRGGTELYPIVVAVIYRAGPPWSVELVLSDMRRASIR